MLVSCVVTWLAPRQLGDVPLAVLAAEAQCAHRVVAIDARELDLLVAAHLRVLDEERRVVDAPVDGVLSLRDAARHCRHSERSAMYKSLETFYR